MSSDTDVLVALNLHESEWVYIVFITAAEIEFKPAEDEDNEDEDLYEDNGPVAYLVIPGALVCCAYVD